MDLLEFSADKVVKERKDGNVGVLVGSFGKKPMQNLYRGLPSVNLSRPPLYEKLKKDTFSNEFETFISSGARYGSTYSLYPGDPFRYHSKYLVFTVDDEDEEFTVEDIVSIGRVSHSANKVAILTDKCGNYSVHVDWFKFDDNDDNECPC